MKLSKAKYFILVPSESITSDTIIVKCNNVQKLIDLNNGNLHRIYACVELENNITFYGIDKDNLGEIYIDVFNNVNKTNLLNKYNQYYKIKIIK